MMTMLFILMMITLLVMVAGVVLMTKGGSLNEKYGNKLMIARVSLQGLCIAMIGILFLTK
jgi:hypothetical protein